MEIHGQGNLQNVSPKSGNLRIFLPLRFYVKSIFKILGVQNTALFAVLEALNFGFGEFQLSKNCKNSSKYKFTASKNGSFGTSTNSEFDFT